MLHRKSNLNETKLDIGHTIVRYFIFNDHTLLLSPPHPNCNYSRQLSMGLTFSLIFPNNDHICSTSCFVLFRILHVWIDYGIKKKRCWKFHKKLNINSFIDSSYSYVLPLVSWTYRHANSQVPSKRCALFNSLYLWNGFNSLELLFKLIQTNSFTRAGAVKLNGLKMNESVVLINPVAFLFM